MASELRSTFVRKVLPAIVWAAIIFVESSIQGSKVPSTPVGFDKLVHAAIFFVLCWLIFRATADMPQSITRPMRLYLALVITIVYGFTDEFHQLYVPGRTADIYDMAADGFGGIVFVGLAIAGRTWMKRTPETREN